MIKISFYAIIDHLHIMYKKSPDNTTKILISGDLYRLNFTWKITIGNDVNNSSLQVNFDDDNVNYNSVSSQLWWRGWGQQFI